MYINLLFSLELPTSELQDIHEIDKILPSNNENDETNNLIEKSRTLWKKWIALKIIFKIPKKIDQHKPNIEINSTELNDTSYPYPMEIATLEPNV